MSSATVKKSGGLFQYRTIDLVTLATLGAAFGVVYWGFAKLYGVLDLAATIGYPPVAGLFLGGWLIAGVVGGLIVRKPGAALLTELTAAFVSMLVLGGTQWGFGVMASGLVQGLGAELALAAFAYRKFTLAVAVLSGTVAAIFGAVNEWTLYFSAWDLQYRLVHLGFCVASGAIIAGALGWLLVRALARAGVLDSFDAGRDLQDAVAHN